MNILVVEPDKIIAHTTKSALKAAGFEVVVCRTAQTALDALDDKLPDVIVLELQLGLHNGIEFLYEIRSYPEWQHIPVVVYTMNVNAQDPHFKQAFADLAVRAVLYKPRTTTNQLVKIVKECVLT